MGDVYRKGIMKLENRIAVVTAGSRGIGRGIAEAFLLEGAQVVINGRDEAKGARAINEMEDLAASNNVPAGRVEFVRSDATVQADVERLIDDTVARHGRVDILVNNAGGSGGHANVGLLSDEAWNEACNWILNSTFWATRRVVEGMKERGFGRIINISSVESKFMNKASISNYSVFKAAVNALGRCVAVEYSQFGVTSNSICPGAIETDLMMSAGAKTAEVLGISYQQFLDNYAQESLTKKLNTVEEVAALAVLLASPEGSGITGSALNVDGGTSPY